MNKVSITDNVQTIDLLKRLACSEFFFIYLAQIFREAMTKANVKIYF